MDATEKGTSEQRLGGSEGTANHGHWECCEQRPWGRAVLVDQEEDSGWSTVWNGGQEVGSEKWGPGHTGSAGSSKRLGLFM